MRECRALPTRAPVEIRILPASSEIRKLGTGQAGPSSLEIPDFDLTTYFHSSPSPASVWPQTQVFAVLPVPETMILRRFQKFRSCW